MDFNALAGEARELLDEHGEQVEAAAEEIGEVVTGRFGHAEQVDAVVEKIEDVVPDRPAQP